MNSMRFVDGVHGDHRRDATYHRTAMWHCRSEGKSNATSMQERGHEQCGIDVGAKHLPQMSRQLLKRWQMLRPYDGTLNLDVNAFALRSTLKLMRISKSTILADDL